MEGEGRGARAMFLLEGLEPLAIQKQTRLVISFGMVHYRRLGNRDFGKVLVGHAE